MDPAAFRAQFPVLERVAYLNAGTDGPIPAAAAEAARDALAAQAGQGRTMAHFEARRTLLAGLRTGYAQLLGCAEDDLAVTNCTTAGLGAVMAGLDLGAGDEIVTSDSEHPGLIGPLIAARGRGATVRAVPFGQLAEAVRATTTLVACSHVNWLTGELAPAALAEVPVPVILDGAQGAGAVRVDVRALNCAAYAAAGQKWLCGADGTGMLYVEPEFGAGVRAIAPGYLSFEDASLGFDSVLHAGARRLDAPSLPREGAALSLAALELLVAAGIDDVLERGVGLAARFAAALGDAGYTVAPRGDSTLVAWEVPDPPAVRERLSEAGVAVRNLPGTPYLRASVGAWNDESDLERLLAGLSAGAAAG
jgi:selenocysteine lyase/cysteine desulfurase